MNEPRLRYKPRISLKKSRDKIAVFGMYGDHGYTPRPKSPREVAILLASLGCDPNRAAEICRDYRQPVPHLQNLLGSTWTVSDGADVQVIDNRTGQVVANVSGPGTVTLSTYLAQFEMACAARDRAVQKSSYADLQTAITHGIASVEAYIAELVKDWNLRHPDDQLLDTRSAKVSLDDKIDLWIPKMSGGATLIKGDQRWSEFVVLRRIRDDETIHPKRGAQAMSLVKLVRLIDAFRLGIAGMLGQLHLHFGQPLPSAIISAVYMPDVEVVTEQKPSH